MKRKLRLGIGGIATESCTFSPLHTTIDDFTIWRGDGRQEIYPYLPAWTWRDRDAIEFIPCLKAWATPGGQVTTDAYAEMKAELLVRIETAIRNLAATRSLRSLAADFDVSHETVRRVIRDVSADGA